MTEREVKEKLLDLFHKEREISSIEFDDSHFLDYLTNPPHKKNTLKNSFKGARSYYNFMNVLELEFAICFTPTDLDKYYSVQRLTKKILERISIRRGNLLIMKQRTEQKANYNIELILTSILLLTFLYIGFNWISCLVSIIYIPAIGWILKSKINTKKHNKQMNLLLKKTSN